LLKQNLDNNYHLFILEDDAIFGASTFTVLHNILPNITKAWDIIYCDICIPSVDEMISLFKIKKELNKTGSVTLLDLSKIQFAGTTSYIINHKSKRKVLAMLEAFTPLEIPLDLAYRYLVNRGHLIAYAIFPFVTSVSHESEKSSIQSNDSAYTELVWNTFRRFIWSESNSDLIRDDIASIVLEADKDASMLFDIIKGFSSSRFLTK
jgi:hypothetical protein